MSVIRKNHVKKNGFVRFVEVDQVASLLYVHKSTAYRWTNDPESMPRAYQELLQHKALGTIHWPGYEHFNINQAGQLCGPNGFQVHPNELDQLIWLRQLFNSQNAATRRIQAELVATKKALESALDELEKLRYPSGNVIPLFGRQLK